MMNEFGERHMVRRDNHPPMSLYWTMESVERGRPVMLYTIGCMFCGRPMITDFKGEIEQVVNAPANLLEFGMSLTTTCKVCKQRYRFIVVESFLGSIDVSEALSL